MYSGSSTTTRKQSRHSLDPGLSDACTIRARRSCNLASVIIPPTCSQTCVFSRANNAAQQIGGESSIFGSRSDRRRSSPGPLGEGERYGGLTGTVDAPSRRTPRSGPQNGPIGSDGRNRRFRGGARSGGSCSDAHDRGDHDQAECDRCKNSDQACRGAHELPPWDLVGDPPP
jgi:hypothetical protein